MKSNLSQKTLLIPRFGSFFNLALKFKNICLATLCFSTKTEYSPILIHLNCYFLVIKQQHKYCICDNDKQEKKTHELSFY